MAAPVSANIGYRINKECSIFKTYDVHLLLFLFFFFCRKVCGLGN